jgi:hypothetical protein
MMDEVKVGPETPTQPGQRGEYIGTDPHLRGERALVSDEGDGTIVAQFNNSYTRHHLGWWRFPKSEWKIFLSDWETA